MVGMQLKCFKGYETKQTIKTHDRYCADNKTTETSGSIFLGEGILSALKRGSIGTIIVSTNRELTVMAYSVWEMDDRIVLVIANHSSRPNISDGNFRFCIS